MTHKKKSSQNLHKPSYKSISSLQTTLETHEHVAANHHTTLPHTHEPRKRTQKYLEIATIPRWSDFPSLDHQKRLYHNPTSKNPTRETPSKWRSSSMNCSNLFNLGFEGHFSKLKNRVGTGSEREMWWERDAIVERGMRWETNKSIKWERESQKMWIKKYYIF